MHFLLESFFVGFYSVILYEILKPFLSETTVLFFCIGFFKHLFGYLLSLHTQYCNYGDACKRTTHDYITNTSFTTIIVESILEGFVFVILDSLFLSIFWKMGVRVPEISIFVTGYVLHVSYEYLGLHDSFCKTRCKRI